MNQNTYPVQDTDSILKLIKLIFRNIWLIVPFVLVALESRMFITDTQFHHIMCLPRY
jgi:hypothetical protein